MTETETQLDLDSLDTRALGLVWGLTSSVAKDGDGNVLLARLAAIFQQQYTIRTGKVTPLGNTEHEFKIDFEMYSVDDLKKAFCHFCALTAAFESNGQRSSSKFCKMIVECISSSSIHTPAPGTRKKRLSNAVQPG
jgi:hypothetical protein